MRPLTISILSLLLYSCTSSATLPTGTFEGGGNYTKASGEEGSYYLKTTIRDDGVVIKEFGDGHDNEKFQYKIIKKKSGFYDVMVDDTRVGSGYCQSAQCHYRINIGNLEMEETYTIKDDKLYGLGSKKENNELMSWEEEQTKK